MIKQSKIINAMNELKKRLSEWDNPPEADDAQRERLRIKQAEMRQRIADYEYRQRSRPKVLVFGNKIVRYAAVFVGILIATTFILLQTRNGHVANIKTAQYMELTNPSSKLPVRYVLPDTSVVYLAAGSTVKYTRTFSTTGRRILLQGEAFFDVKRDESRPFTVRSGNMETRVLGTSFKITAFDGQEMEVAVASGKVSVNFTGGENESGQALLTRGSKVRYNPQTGEVTRGEVDVLCMEQWKLGKLIFDEQAMNLVARQLSARYGIPVLFADPEAANHRVSGTFGIDETVFGVLDMLGFVGKFRYEEINGEKIIIYSLK
jgi:ferric-dicitrate binding protein FerR (iron transport regulator)